MSIQEQTIGAPIVATVKNPDGTIRDISTATTHDFIFKKPDGIKVTKTGSFLTNGTDGRLVYITIAAEDLMPPGLWLVQSDIVQPGFSGKSKVANFMVVRNL